MSEFFTLLSSPAVSLLAFILTIAFLVTIHEYGHFWVARRFGVRIERFSIGFGKPIIKWYGKRDNTEYSIAWIPLGGYVKMYGETASQFENSGNTSSDDNSDTPGDNAANNNAANNNAAGNNAAGNNAAGNNAASNSGSTYDYSDIAQLPSGTGSFSALPPFKRFLIAFAGPAVNLVFAVFTLWLLFIIGIPAIKPTIGDITANSRMAQTTLAVNDNITSIDGHAVSDINDAVMRLVDQLGNPSVSITATDNNGITKDSRIDLSDLPKGSELHLSETLGIDWAWVTVMQSLPATLETIQADSPASVAGLQPGDTIIRTNQKAINYWQEFVKVVRENPEKPISLQIKRHGQKQQLTLTPQRNPRDATQGFAGVTPAFDEQLLTPLKTRKQYTPWEALSKSVSANYLQASLMLKTLGRLVSGQASVKNLGGPISIADVSGRALRSGYISYFYILASLSLILAVMNLLPIPVLDGGHMLLYLIEMVRGKPVSEKTADILLRIGMSIVLTFMLLAITVDLWRYLIA